MSETMTDDEIREARSWAYWTDADRDRVFATVDALRARVECAEREREDTLRMWREYKLAKDAEVANADAARERAEAERDEAVVKYAEVARENATGLAAFIERGEALKRAEADNAALLGRIRSTKRLIEAGQPLAALADIEEDERHGLLHPGTAMLEYQRALERVREAVRRFDAYFDLSEPLNPCEVVAPEDPAEMNTAMKEMVDACTAADALKGES